MRYYVDSKLENFLSNDVEAVIELIKKAYISTKFYYEDKVLDDFLYFNAYKTFTDGYCFYFVRLLKSIFKEGTFVVKDKDYYLFSHIMFKLNNEIYDINGIKNIGSYYYDLHNIKMNHNQVNEEVFKTFKDFFYIYLKEYVGYNKNFVEK